MRSVLLGGVIAAALGMAPGAASAQDERISPELAAYLEVSAGTLFPISSFFMTTPTPVFIAAPALRVNFNLRGSWDLQVDLQSLSFVSFDTTSMGITGDAHFGNAFAHLYNRWNSNAAGVFGGLSAMSGGVVGATAGAEAIHFGERFSVLGQASYSRLTQDFITVDPSINSYQARLAVTYYATPNTSIYAEALDTLYTMSTMGFSFNVNTLSGILGVRHHYEGLPLTVFAQLRGDGISFNFGGSYSEPFWVGSAVLGFSIAMGGGQNTLRQADETIPWRVRWAPPPV